MKINEYLEMTREEYSDLVDFEMLRIRPRIVCADGFDVSVQASDGHYCSPRLNVGPYSSVEVGYPSSPIPEMDEYDAGGVFGHVPVEVVDAVLEQHGGIANGVYP